MFDKTATILVMAIVLAVIIAMALLIYLPAFTAYAEGEEAEVETVTTTCLTVSPTDLEHNAYAGTTGVAVKDLNTDETVFYLPQSYFLTNVEYQRIARFNFEYYTFSYAGLDTSKWYVEYSENLTVQTVTFAVDENPFPDVRLTLKEDAAPNLDEETVLTNEYTIKFLGFNETGESYYVSATKDAVTKYAMIEKSAFVENAIPYQARTQAEREELLRAIASEPKAGDIVPNTSKTLRIILIVGICVPAALIVLLLFKPTKGARRTSVPRERRRDEFDYDDARSYRRDDRDYDRRDERDYDRRDDRYYRDDRDYRDDRRDYRDDRDRDRREFRDDRR